MPERTTTVWTCSRCGCTEEVNGTTQPPNWIRVSFVTPPRASYEKVTVIGDLCNRPGCGGLLVAFVNGTDDVEKDKQANYEAMMARVVGGDGGDGTDA